MPPAVVLHVAVPVPLRRLFDYLPPPGPLPEPGCRVRVPFGRRRLVGVVCAVSRHSELPDDRLRSALERLDDTPLLRAEDLALLSWTADYYHYPLGEVVAAALPVMLRQGRPARSRGLRRWRLSAAGQVADTNLLQRAPRQAELFAALRAAATAGMTRPELAKLPGTAGGALRALLRRGWVEEMDAAEAAAVAAGDAPSAAPGLELNSAQRSAVETLAAARGFTAFLLDGVTGSGKTEVYLQAIAEVVGRGLQALLLVPEIGLTPQLLARVEERFGSAPAVLHSGLADGERLDGWLAARDGRAPVVVGTRSAIFVPLARPGLIVVDEEHDPSYKQQEGFRYHARDLAILRASRAAIPVLLGSATASLETLYNAERGRYRTLRLPQRAGVARPPRIDLVDMRGQRLVAGLSPKLLTALDEVLGGGGQALVYLNRRGFAPTLLCQACGWLAECRRCDARMTLHLGRGRLCCHHCGSERPPEAACPECGSGVLHPVGHGTERLEALLAARYRDHGVVRIDRDTTRRRGSLDAMLNGVHEGRYRLLVGTQMLAKGHDFPNVTLVGVVNADAGLFSTDFRASERVAQQIVQVVGRAGRAERPGRVLVQTYHPGHPLLQALVEHGYHAFAANALAERKAAAMPPYGHLALLRAEAAQADTALAFLEAAAARLESDRIAGIEVWGPVPAPMPRRAGQQRAQLLLLANRREHLQAILRGWAARIEGDPLARTVRWSLDVDPIELF